MWHRDYTERERHDLLHKEAAKIKIERITPAYGGLIPKLHKSGFP